MSRGLQLDVPDNVYAHLERKAEETGQPLAEIAVRWLASASARELDPLRRRFGTLHADMAIVEDYDEHLGAELLNDHRPPGTDHAS